MIRISYYLTIISILMFVSSCGKDYVHKLPKSSDEVSESTYNNVLDSIAVKDKDSDPVSVLFKARKYFPANFKITLEDTGNDIVLNEAQKRLQVAQSVTRTAQLEVIRNIREGISEDEIKQIALASFQESKASGEAFSGVVASGKNSTNINYYSGSRPLQYGDLVLVNVGAKVDGYCGDISRTYPVSGTFTERQKQIYKLVLDTLNHVLKSIVPGKTSLNEIDDIALTYLRKSGVTARDTSGKELTMDYFMKRSIAHYTDRKVANLFKNIPIAVGRTVSIGPGIYIESEDIGVRIEDTYLVTQDKVIGYIFMPESVYDIEYLFKQR